MKAFLEKQVLVNREGGEQARKANVQFLDYRNCAGLLSAGQTTGSHLPLISERCWGGTDRAS